GAAELEEAAHVAAAMDAARRRQPDPAEEPQERALPGAVVADDPERLAPLDGEAHVLECRDGVDVAEAPGEPLRRRLAQRARPVAAHPEPLGDALDGDDDCHGTRTPARDFVSGRY